MISTSGIPLDLVERLGHASNIIVFTGAGVSAESGVPTFRGQDGLWQKYNAEDLATWQAFERDPRLVWSWYDYRRQIISDVDPNPGHTAIAGMAAVFDKVTVVTQNVDGLHLRAGSEDVVELHGNIWRARCTRELTVCDFCECPLEENPPLCRECGSILRPDVVWFGEPLPMDAYERSHEAACTCDAMLVVGTSAEVRPAATLPLVAKHNGAFVVEVNTHYTPISALIDTTLIGVAGEILPELLDHISEYKGHPEEVPGTTGEVKERSGV